MGSGGRYPSKVPIVPRLGGEIERRENEDSEERLGNHSAYSVTVAEFAKLLQKRLAPGHFRG
jgi:hypothetical protein